jgi:dimethylamine monooxygenase subunit C
MLVSGIKSRPIYKGLIADPHARLNVVCADGAGAESVLTMAQSAPAGFMGRSALLYVPGHTSSPSAVGSGFAEHLTALLPDALWVYPTIATLLVRLDGLLGTAVMGTRLYVAGTEGLIGECMLIGMRHGIDQASIRTEHRGSERRRLQCVHCKGITENVVVNPVRCSHCGLALLVRDHYSRRMGAFQGVCIDAEVPGDVPAPEEKFR